MKLLERANAYCRQMDWKDMALLKVCLFALGMVSGMAIPRERRRAALLGASLAFVATWVPQMAKFLREWTREEEEPEREWYLEYED